MTHFLGIDPGLERTGFGIISRNGGDLVLDAYGVITTPKEDTIPQRLVQIQSDLQSILNQFPDIAAAGVEELFFGNNVNTAIPVAQARGVVLFTLEQNRCIIEEVKPVQVKSAIAGNGRATKAEMQRIVQLTFGLESLPQPDDAADAIAIAMTAAALHQHTQTL
jgi:crossover junction endodeoxyribonuclease RuvC